jgi:hypothetical protein
MGDSFFGTGQVIDALNLVSSLSSFPSQVKTYFRASITPPYYMPMRIA